LMARSLLNLGVASTVLFILAVSIALVVGAVLKLHLYESRCWQWCKAFFTPSCLNGGQCEQPAVQQCIHRHMDIQRVQRMRKLTYVSACLEGLIGASIVYTICLGMPRWMSMRQDFLFILHSVVTVFILACPKLQSANIMTSMYSIYMIILIFVWESSTTSMALFQSMVMHPYRMLHSLACFQPGPVICWNIAASVFSILYFATLEDACNEQVTLIMFCWGELCQSLCVVGVLVGWYRTSLKETKQTIECLNAKSRNSATTSLLEGVCDVVLELDASMNIIWNSPKLASLLMLSHGRSVQNISLQEFMPDKDDQQRLADNLLSCSHEAGALSVKMQDSMGSKLQVELFYMTFDSLDEQVHHMVGIREYTDTFPLIKACASEDVAARREPNNSTLMSSSSSSSNDRHATRRNDGATRSRRSSLSGSSNNSSNNSSHSGAGRSCQSSNGGRGGGGWGSGGGDGCSSDGGSSNSSNSSNNIESNSNSDGESGGAKLHKQTANAKVKNHHGTAASIPITGQFSKHGHALKKAIVPAETPVRLRYPHLKETDSQAKEIMILDVVMAWNVDIKRSSCCLHHRYLQDASAALKRLFKRDCGCYDGDPWSVQCQECGVLARPKADEKVDWQCSVCRASSRTDLQASTPDSPQSNMS